MSVSPAKKAHRPLLHVDEALARVLDLSDFVQTAEMLSLWQAQNRVLAKDLAALRTQPPFDVSAMDGYAVKQADIATTPAALRLVGESAAGHGFSGFVQAGECVRIFTGAPVPNGADTVILQEDTSREGESVSILRAEPLGRHIRSAGLDFTRGQILLKKGERLDGRSLGLAAALNHAHLPVARRPKVGILATGDELALPGEARSDADIICSNNFAVAALVREAGGEPVDLGIARDNFEALEASIRRAQAEKLDILVTLGGASVGDHDLVQKALANEGMSLNFWQIAMRPGKPLMHGRLGPMRILGLPGNPVASYVCSLLFLQPLIRAMQGETDTSLRTQTAILAEALKANDHRQDYLRATLHPSETPIATAFAIQDSSMLSTLAAAQCLIIRAPNAPPASKGEKVQIIKF